MLKILLIEDDPVDRKAIERAIAKAGLQAKVTHAETGAEGLETFKKFGFDCILLDFRLPDMTGLEFLRKLEKAERDKWKAVIVLTGLSFDAVAVEALRAGAQGFIEKNELNPLRLVHAIQSAIERQQLMVKNREIQKDLAAKANFLEVINETMGDGLLVSDETGTVISANKACRKIFGHGEKSLVGKNANILMVAGEAKAFARDIKRFLENGKTELIGKGVKEIRGCRKDGLEITLEVSVNANWEDGKAFFVTSVTDITERKAAEAELLDTQKKLRMLSDNATDIIIVHGPDGEIDYISRAVNKHLGLEPRDLVGRQSMGAIHPEDMKTLNIEWDRTVLKEGRTFNRDLRYRTKKGEYLWFECVSEPVKNKAGQIIGAVTCSRKIDEFKKAEEEALKFGRIIEDSLNEIYVFDAKTLKYTMTNRGAQMNLGYSEKELRNMGPLDINPTFTKKTIEELMEPLRTGKKEIITFETVHKRKDGSLYDVHVQLQLSKVGSEEVFVAIEEDITEQKAAEAKAAESETKFRLLTEYASDIIIQRTRDDVILYVSPSVITHLGVDPEEFMASKSWERVHPDDRHAFKTWQKTVFEEGKRFNARMRIMAGDGEYKWFDSVTDPIRDKKGKVVSAVTASRNIDDQIKAEEKLRQTQKLEAIGNLTGGVAHDFNNLLTAILGSLQYLKMISDDLPKEALDLIEIALKSGQKGADLTKRLLALSRKQDLKPTVFGVNALLKHMMPLFKRTIRENIEIEARLLEKEGFIEIDQGELENALLNMAVNAKDAMPKGGKLDFEITRQRLSESNSALKEVAPGDYIVISISDTGHGMTPEVREKIFEPFYTTKDVGKGTGLGLSMVYSLVAQSGGHVSVYTEEDKGTIFRLYFPEAKTKKTKAAKKRARVDMQKKEKGTILLVEDDTGVRGFVIRALEAKGYTVFEAGDGPEALKIMKKTRHFDLLLTDVILPKGMSGFEVAAEFRQIHPKAGIILSSGYTGTTIRQSGWLEDETELLSKPFDLEVLLNRVAEEIRKGRKTKK